MSGPSSNGTLCPAYNSVACPSATVHAEQSSGTHDMCIEHDLTCGQRLWFSEVASQHQNEFVGAVRDCTRRLDLIEICAPWDSPLSQAVLDLGGSAMRLGVHNGFDLGTRAGLTKALQVVRKLRPRYAHFSPPCDPWTSMNNANQNTIDQVLRLEEKRRVSRRLLKNCRTIMEVQMQELQGDAGGEHPLRAQSWSEVSWKHMCKLGSGRFRVDGCMFGCKSPKSGRPLQKPWGWFSSCESIRQKLQRRCTHENHEHDPIEGEITSSTAVYPRQLCLTFAKALMSTKVQVDSILKSVRQGSVFANEVNETDFSHEGVETEETNGCTDETEKQTRNEEETETWSHERILHRLRTIHANLGHPSNTVLCRLLKEAKADQKIQLAAMKFECDFCRQRGHASMHRPSAVPRECEKWEAVSVDTFWWHSPHRDEAGNPKEFVVGISFLDEGTDFHVARIVRTGKKRNVPNVTSLECQKAFTQDWLKTLPKPKYMRFDDEGAFRDKQFLSWLESMFIQIQVIAGEAAWQVGKHSRHLEVLKENMTLLSLEQGPDTGSEELLAFALSAKNSLHQTRGYSPNQWVFGQEKEQVGSWLQFGNHLPMNSRRYQDRSFEQNIQDMQKARETFLKADARRRILRAEKGKARKAEVFEPGQLVYFYRKGRNSTSRRETGWYGPAKVVAVEKTGQNETNQTQGSVIWITHGVVLYRCAPEQLRKVTGHLQTMSDSFKTKTVFEEIQEAGNKANYRDISLEIKEWDEDDEVHEIEPRFVIERSDDKASLDQDPTPLKRARTKQSQHGQPVPHRSAEAARSDSEPGQQESRLSGGGQQVSSNEDRRFGTGSLEGRSPSEKDMSSGLQRELGLRDLASAAPARESQICQHPRVCPPSANGEQSREQERIPYKGEVSGSREAGSADVHPQDKGEFWRRADTVRGRQRVERSESAQSRSHAKQSAATACRDDGHDEKYGHGISRSEHTPAQSQPDSREPAGSDSPNIQRGHADAGDSAESRREADHVRESRQEHEVRGQMSRLRSRSPRGTRYDALGAFSVEIKPELFPITEDSEQNVSAEKSDAVENIGNILPKGYETDDLGHDERLNLGCFGRRRFEKTETKRNDVDVQSCFWQQVQQGQEVCEIHFELAPRDVHQVTRNGIKEWKINDKPKKRAEVHFRQLNDGDKLSFLGAMKNEVGSYLDHEAVEIASKAGIDKSRIMGMRWVLTWKDLEEPTEEGLKQKPKARLIIKGFQDPDLLVLQRDSPTLSNSNRNIILALSAQYGWSVSAGDIKTAFLNGDKTEASRDVFAEPPEEVKQMLGMKPWEIFRILKAVYGLLHAPREWWKKLACVLEEQGWIRSRLEPCVWRLYDKEGQLCGLIGGHVDDLLCGGNGNEYDSKIAVLRKSFPFGSWKEAKRETITFCGCEISQRVDGSIELNQERYADSISEINLTKERKKCLDAPATEAERKQLRAVLGALSWRATQTAPWMCATISYLQGAFKDATVQELLETNKLVRTQKQFSNIPLLFPVGISNPILVTFHDASWASRKDGSSQGGMLSVLADESIMAGGLSSFAPIAWQSKKLARVCRSSTSAEVQMASTGLDAHEFLKQMLLEWHNKHEIPLNNLDDSLKQIKSVIVTDSKNFYDSVVRVVSSGLQLEEKRLAIEIISFKERRIATGTECRWVDSDQQLADSLSKAFEFDALLHAFQKQKVALLFDPMFMSARKKRAQRNQTSETMKSLFVEKNTVPEDLRRS